MHKIEDKFWSLATNEIFDTLQTGSNGLSSGEALSRLEIYGPNIIDSNNKTSTFRLLLSQFKNSIILLLIFATGLSLFLGNFNDAIIIFIIIFISTILGFLQERRASNIIKKLLEMVQLKTSVIRNGNRLSISTTQIVPGDLVVLNAGSGIPADCIIVESKDLFVNESTLTGESYPVEKSQQILPLETPLHERTNCIFMDTHIVSGIVKAVVVNTGKRSEIGKLSQHIKTMPPETEFEQGVRKFSFLLVEVTIILVSFIFLINVYFERPVLDSFLFALALSIGLTPQLLPAIISINLSHGAKRMALKKVIVKKLASIENLGSMNILCSDKTGTLTEGNIKLKFALDTEGRVNDKVLFYAYLNSTFESGFINPIDDAIRSSKEFDLSAYKKLDEIPYDFVRKRISVLVSYKNNANIMVTKGAVKNIFNICSKVEVTGEKIIELAVLKDSLQKKFEELSLQGLRILGLAYRNDVDISIINKNYERDMIFLGFLVFFDPIKPGIVESIKKLKKLKVSLKIISGDNLYVTSHLGKEIGLISKSEILTGSEISHMTPESLTRKVRKVNIFAEIEPAQKEQIILALRKSGNIVGYLGDGVNDAAAIHSADVGISVDKSTDVLKETADIVLLEKDISVLIDGIMEGRRTFANTMKYVFMATSANFGNMFSMAGVSLFLTFLPLLPKQILLTNLMTDFPEMTISTDNVDKEIIQVPRHWDLKFIRKFMLVFGFLSTFFDFLTFIVILNILHANIEQFRTTWFMESVISASLVVLIIRSKKPLVKSTPGKFLLITTLIVNIFVLAIPLTPVGPIFGFVVIPLTFYLSIGIIVLVYVLMAEVTKWIFYRLVKM